MLVPKKSSSSATAGGASNDPKPPKPSSAALAALAALAAEEDAVGAAMEDVSLICPAMAVSETVVWAMAAAKETEEEAETEAETALAEEAAVLLAGIAAVSKPPKSPSAPKPSSAEAAAPPKSVEKELGTGPEV